MNIILKCIFVAVISDNTVRSMCFSRGTNNFLVCFEQITQKVLYEEKLTET